MNKKEAIDLAARELARENETVLDATQAGESIVAFLATSAAPSNREEFVISAARIKVLLGKARPATGEPFRIAFDHQALAEGRYQDILDNLG